jgi:hypothetical protein
MADERSSGDLNAVFNTLDSVKAPYGGLRELLHEETRQMSDKDEYAIRKAALQTS